MNGDMMIKGSERKVWNTPVLEGLQGVADVRIAPKGKGADTKFTASS
jgi:hypothetical protein